MLHIIFGILIGLAHYFSNRLDITHERHRKRTISLTAGVFIAYIFLHMLPFLYSSEIAFNRVALFCLLMGFSLFYLIDKYLYQHESPKKFRMMIKETHGITFFFYHFIIGIVLFQFAQMSIISSILLFIPILSFTAVSNISMKEVHDFLTDRKSVRVLLSLSTLFGAIAATFVPIPGIVYFGLFGFIVGTLMHVVMFEAMPKGRDVSSLYFILGLVLYSILIEFAWLV